MNKHIKRLLIAVLVIALLAGGTYGGLTIYRNTHTAPVNVYRVDDFSVSDVWMDQNEASGSVRMDRMQKIYLSDTQTVTEVFVREGQKVKEGDPLLAFDTTLSKLDVEKAEIALEKQRMELQNQQQFLERLQTARITEDLEAWMKSLEAQIEAAYASMPEPEYPEIPFGEWTMEEPRYIGNPGVFDPEALLEESGLDDIFVVFVDAFEGEYFGYYGLEISRGEPSGYFPDEEETPDSSETESTEGEASASSENEESGASESEESAPSESTEPTSPEESEDPEPTEPSKEDEEPICLMVFSPMPIEPENEAEIPAVIPALEAQMEEVGKLFENAYTRAELAELKVETAKTISDLELEIRIAEVNLEKAKAEVSDGTLRATTAGEVVSVLPMEEMGRTYDAALVISGGGGYYITASVGEYDREKISVGQEMDVMSYMDGMMYTGTVTEIGDRPTDEYGWSSGNNNISWYPFTVFVDASAELQEGDWVGVTYSTQDESAADAWYLEKFLIRRENGRNYVYKRGEDGKLAKQYIETGRLIWDEYYEIRSGLSKEDLVAFPYGRDVTDGAECEEKGMEALYEAYQGIY